MRKWRAVGQRTVGHEMVFSAAGLAGDVVQVSKPPNRLFRVKAVEIGDTSPSPGRGTKVELDYQMLGARIGGQACVLSADFSLPNLRVMRHGKLSDHPGLPTAWEWLGITFTVRFLSDCQWQCRLLGEAFVCDRWEEVL